MASLKQDQTWGVTENKVPQNRETREKMRKPRLKKFSNLFMYLTK